MVRLAGAQTGAHGRAAPRTSSAAFALLTAALLSLTACSVPLVWPAPVEPAGAQYVQQLGNKLLLLTDCPGDRFARADIESFDRRVAWTAIAATPDGVEVVPLWVAEAPGLQIEKPFGVSFPMPWRLSYEMAGTRAKGVIVVTDALADGQIAWSGRGSSKVDFDQAKAAGLLRCPKLTK